MRGAGSEAAMVLACRVQVQTPEKRHGVERLRSQVHVIAISRLQAEVTNQPQFDVFEGFAHSCVCLRDLGFS